MESGPRAQSSRPPRRRYRSVTSVVIGGSRTPPPPRLNSSPFASPLTAVRQPTLRSLHEPDRPEVRRILRR
ncbi:hypothetical protein ACFFX0_14820 [Citricoccus parietis]|uniref:Uncharacterized protein n=1 Tax=Citricoccus parietis TaxID=592307 RepID=A0ABV5G0E2_9MICC